MKNYNSAFILNALVLPGTGHYMIGQKVKGIIMGTSVTALIFIPVIRYMWTVLDALNSITVSDTALKSSVGALSSSWISNKTLIIICLIGVLAIWLYGIIDLAHIKKKETHGM